jgi:hypothetical protein
MTGASAAGILDINVHGMAIEMGIGAGIPTGNHAQQSLSANHLPAAQRNAL